MLMFALLFTLVHADPYDDRIRQRQAVAEQDELARQYAHYNANARKMYRQVRALIAQGGGERAATVCFAQELHCFMGDCRGNHEKVGTLPLESLPEATGVSVTGCRLSLNRGNLECSTYRDALKDWNTLYAKCVGPDPRSPAVTLSTGGATGKRKHR